MLWVSIFILTLTWGDLLRDIIKDIYKTKCILKEIIKKIPKRNSLPSIIPQIKQNQILFIFDSLIIGLSLYNSFYIPWKEVIKLNAAIEIQALAAKT